MLAALLLAWLVVSTAVAALLAKLARQRHRAALPAECRTRLERARVLAVDAEITVVGRRLGAGRGGEVVLDCDGARTTLSLDELLEAPVRGAPAYLSFSQNSAGMSCAILRAPFAPP